MAYHHVWSNDELGKRMSEFEAPALEHAERGYRKLYIEPFLGLQETTKSGSVPRSN